MTRMRTRAGTWKGGLLLLAGLLAGGALATTLRDSMPTEGPGRAEALARGTPEREARASEELEAAQRRLATLEKQVAALARQQAEAAPGVAPVPAAPTSPERLAALTVEQRVQAKQEAQEEFLQQADAHERTSVDPAWAPRAERSLETALGGLLAARREGERGRLMGLECRDSSCLATVEYPNQAAAMSDAPELVTHFYDDVRCMRRGHMDEPEDPTAPLRVSVLFEQCERP